MSKKMALSSHQAGFTLVELLVVMALMSIVMLAMIGALRGMGQTQARVDQRLVTMDEFWVGTGFIRATLGRVSARRSEVLGADGKPSIQFEGLPQSIAWLGVMPAREGAGGRYFFRLALEPVGDLPGLRSRTVLMARFLPFSGRSGALNWSQADSRILVNDVQQFSVEYEDRSEVPSVWKATWDSKDRMPDAVRIGVITSSVEWPPVSVPLRLMPQGASAGSGVATFGGGAVQ